LAGLSITVPAPLTVGISPTIQEPEFFTVGGLVVLDLHRSFFEDHGKICLSVGFVILMFGMHQIFVFVIDLEASDFM
jgi:hypothetical protein